MSDVQRKGNKFGLCLAPGETDVGSHLARIFGQMAEGLITASYAKKTGGTIPTTIWADQASGFLPGSNVPATVSSMFDWLAASNPDLQTKAQAFSSYFDQVGFSSAVPDIIDQTKKEWYEIKPGSPTGLAAGMKKLANIPVWMQTFALPYKAGTAYNPGPKDDIGLLAKLPFGFGNLIQMAASAIGGVEDIKIELVFRRMRPGLILYWICVSVTFIERAVDLDAVTDLVENIVKWTVIFTIRAGNGNAGDPQKPVEVTVECHDATIEESFVPGPVGLMGAVLRSPPGLGYSVLGGPMAWQILRQRDQNNALALRLFQPLPVQRSLSRGEIALAVAGLTALVALSLWAVTAMGQVEAAPPALALSQASVAAFDALGAEATLTATETVMATETVTATATTADAVTGQAVERMLVEQAWREGLKQANRMVLSQGTRFVLSQPRASAVVAGVVVQGLSSIASAAEHAPATASGQDGVVAPVSHVTGLELIQLVPWLNPNDPLNNFVTPGAPPAPRQWVNMMGGHGIFLYTSKVTSFPELNVNLGIAEGSTSATLLSL